MSAPKTLRNGEVKAPGRKRGRKPAPPRAMINLIAKENGKRQHYFSVVLKAPPHHVMRAIQELAQAYKETGLFDFQKQKNGGTCPECGRGDY